MDDAVAINTQTHVHTANLIKHTLRTLFSFPALFPPFGCELQLTQVAKTKNDNLEF